MSNLQNEVREKLKKSDALSFLKEISTSMSKEEFINFSNTAMKSAYDKKRIKAVEYMLSFYEYDSPSLLMRIHLQVMMEDSKSPMILKDKEMLKVLIKNFSNEFCAEVIESFMTFRNLHHVEKYKERSKEIFKIILEEKLQKNEIVKSKLSKI